MPTVLPPTAFFKAWVSSVDSGVLAQSQGAGVSSVVPYTFLENSDGTPWRLGLQRVCVCKLISK